MTIKMRTIRQTHKLIKSLDPDTAITESALRRLVAEGHISATYIGSKALLNEDEVFAFFAIKKKATDDNISHCNTNTIR